jgi:hypothetical protein
MSNVISLPRRDWTEAEDAEIARLARACGTRFQLECSHTDEGDPWCVVRESRNSTIIVHIAKIDRRYVIVVPFEGRSQRPDTMGAAVDQAVEALQRASVLSAVHPNGGAKAV